MTTQNPAAYSDQAHFRVPAGFMPMVHSAARRRGLTAASFMRMAILDACHRFGVTEPEQDAA